MEYPTLQTSVNAAYSRWQANSSWSMEDFWDSLDAKERFAVFLGNLNYQVENGGFSQWFFNRYGCQQTVSYIERACARIGTVYTKQVAMLVTEAWQLHQEGNDDDEDGCDPLSTLDEAFYKVNDQFMADCEAFITGGKV